MTTAFILDVVIAALLGVTIFYCWRLNRRLVALRKGREELAALVSSLTEATKKAETGIGQLKTASEAASQDLKKDLAAARSLRDELALITETGNNLANRLEAGFSSTNRQAANGSVDLESVRAARSENRAHRDGDDGASPDAPSGRNDSARAELFNMLRQAR